jgi:hypothetical protein
MPAPVAVAPVAPKQEVAADIVVSAASAARTHAIVVGRAAASASPRAGQSLVDHSQSRAIFPRHISRIQDKPIVCAPAVPQGMSAGLFYAYTRLTDL